MKHALKLARRTLPGLLVFVAGIAGCDDGTPSEDDDDSPTGASIDVTALTGTSGFQAPLDAVPTSDASRFYFVAQGSAGPAIFAVAGSGGPIGELYSGDVLAQPRGIMLAADDQTLYIADRGDSHDALLPGSSHREGGVYVFPLYSASSRGTAASANPTLLAGTEGYDVLNVQPDKADSSSEDIKVPIVEKSAAVSGSLYFSGIDPSDGQGGVWRIPLEGGEPVLIVKGNGLIVPDGLALTRAGDCFVSDHQGEGGGDDRVFKISGGKISVLLENITLGDPGGLAVTMDGRTLLVSARDTEKGTDQVILVDLETAGTSLFTDVIGENHDGGGLHRALGADIFAWSDRTHGGNGAVYRVEVH